jgi:hypothetical protein
MSSILQNLNHAVEHENLVLMVFVGAEQWHHTRLGSIRARFARDGRRKSRAEGLTNDD